MKEELEKDKSMRITIIGCDNEQPVDSSVVEQVVANSICVIIIMSKNALKVIYGNNLKSFINFYI